MRVRMRYKVEQLTLSDNRERVRVRLRGVFDQSHLPLDEEGIDSVAKRGRAMTVAVYCSCGEYIVQPTYRLGVEFVCQFCWSNHHRQQRKPVPEMCCHCGEMIPIPVMRRSGDYICEDCWPGNVGKKIDTGPRESGEAADRQYHGGRFYAGEW